MKVLKVLLGWICLVVAILPGTLLLSFATSGFYKISQDLPLTISVAWFGSTGVFLLARKNTPLSRAVRIRLALNLVLCISFFTLVAAPDFIRSRSTSCCNACINNLRQIDAAANEFALENHLTNGASVNFPNDLTPYIKLNSQGKIPSCPDGGVYHLSRVGDNPTCSLGNTVTPGHYLP